MYSYMCITCMSSTSYLYSFGKIFSQSLHSWTGSSLSSRSCLKSSLSESKMEPALVHEYFWCRRSSRAEEKSSSQSSQRYICSSVHRQHTDLVHDRLTSSVCERNCILKQSIELDKSKPLLPIALLVTLKLTLVGATVIDIHIKWKSISSER